MSGGDAPAPAPGDLLAAVLDLASREGALTGDALAAFREALAERAGIVLAERVARLEERLRTREEEAASLRAQLQRSAAAHDALLAHHRHVVEQVIGELAAVAALSPLRARLSRQRLRALAELLRADTR